MDREYNILDTLPIDLPTISDFEGHMLICEVTWEEVYQVILELPTGKSPGPNGFNVEFYRAFRPIISDHLAVAVRHFFDNFVLPSS